MDREQLLKRIGQFPRAALSHLPTPFEQLPAISETLGGVSVFCKRDDCTGLAFGGNKVRQLEFHFGAALAQGATTVLITGAVQSNYVRTAAGAAAKLGLECEVQLENRVQDTPTDYDKTGNVLLNRLFGAQVHHFPVGEDEDGADHALDELAEEVLGNGGVPYVIHLGAGHVPLGSLGYVDAAVEVLDDGVQNGVEFDDIVVASGSASTHAGLLVGCKLLNNPVRIHGMCVRRPAEEQRARVLQTVRAVEALLDVEPMVAEEDILVYDDWFGGRYGHPDASTMEALKMAARLEGLVLDPVYTAKAFAGLIGLARRGTLEPGSATVFVHTGGTPALFAYESLITEGLGSAQEPAA